MAINWHVYNFWLNIGWYSGDPFRVFSVSIFETLEDCYGKVDHLTIFDITVLHFTIAFGLRGEILHRLSGSAWRYWLERRGNISSK